MPKTNTEEKNRVFPDGFVTRSAAPGTLDEKNRTIRATIATNEPVMVYDWTRDENIMEVLSTSGMTMPNKRQVPLLDSHMRYNGTESVRGSCRGIKDAGNGTIEADVHFSSTAEDDWIRAKEGDLTDLSVGYQTSTSDTVEIPHGQKYVYDGRTFENNFDCAMLIRTKWKPFEVSILPIGADERCKFRSISQPTEERQMPTEKTVEAPVVPATPAPQNFDADAVRKMTDAAKKEAAEGERARVSAINLTCRELKVPDEFAKSFIDGGKTELEARTAIVVEAQRLLTEQVKTPTVDVRMGNDSTENAREGMLNGLLVRSGYPVEAKVKTDVAKSEYNGASIQSIARSILFGAGFKGSIGWDNVRVANEILAFSNGQRGVAQATGDFPYILAAAANKFLMLGYTEQNTTWQLFCGKQSLNDFKQNKLVNISLFSDIDKINEGDNMNWGKQTDKGEYITLFNWGKAYRISYQAIVNDDKDAFSRIPRNMAGAVNRKQEREVYDLLYGAGGVGPLMNEDSLYMFDATATTGHANYTTGSGTALSVTSLGVGRAALKKIKLPKPDKTSKTIYSNADAKFLLVPTTKQTLAEQLIGSPADPTAQLSAGVVNPFQNKLTVIASAILDEKSSTGWYLLTDPNQVQHIVMGTLSGEEAPQLRTAPTAIGEARGIDYDIGFSFAAGVADWRGAYLNTGA